MLSMLTKKKFLLVSFFGSLCTICIFVLLQQREFPLYDAYCEAHTPWHTTMIIDCTGTFVAYVLLIFVPVLIFSLVTYRIKEAVFLSWKKFTIIYLFIYLFIVAVSPWSPGDIDPFTKGYNSLLMVYLYSGISITLIAYKSYQLKGKK